MKKPLTVDKVIARLQSMADPEKIILKEKKFSIVSRNPLGVYHKDLKVLAKEIGQDNDLALQLFDSGIYEARLLCSKLFKPKDVTEDLMEKWVRTFENWEICDSFCMGLFAKNKLAVKKILDWHLRQPEFERRAAFAIIAAYCMADKHADNEVFESFFPIIKKTANDDRIYVKKAVNWALRNIGKRNRDLNQSALSVAREILQMDSKSAQWIAKDALRELEKPKVRMSDYPRSIYRTMSEF